MTLVVINNREYNILKKFMRFQPHYAAARLNPFVAMDIVDLEIDFLHLARSMGMAARRIECARDIAAAIEAGIASAAPNLIGIPVAPLEKERGHRVPQPAADRCPGMMLWTAPPPARKCH